MPHLKTLFCYSQDLTQADIGAFLNRLNGSVGVSGLVLSNNCLGDDGVGLLVDGLRAMPDVNIRYLSVRENHLTNAACDHLHQLRLTDLDVSNNAIDDTGVYALMGAQLQSLSLEGTNVSMTLVRQLQRQGLAVDFKIATDFGYRPPIKSTLFRQPKVLTSASNGSTAGSAVFKRSP